ncbi:MAG TPA: NAD/NADP octopine/nopaline dehydrogenase family protein [Gemmataceae bacterium]|nr:NAD/NADP octopine/nopaline dehydrogenase family protein [Gemmataceae bacterium]
MAKIGIYGVSSQSGAAYFADLIADGAQVYGFARTSPHGRAVVEAIRKQDGIQVDRPENEHKEASHFVPLLGSEVGQNLERLACESDLIILAHPSVYHEETVRQLAEFLPRAGRHVPLVLSPSRTLAAPYCWEILGDDYPIVSFQTCPYACKCFRPGAVYLKSRKRAWIASTEGCVDPKTVVLLRSLFPQVVFSRTPAATSLGNIGAVFHPTAYILNLPAIREAKAAGHAFSFYLQGIAHNPLVGPIVEEVDQIRLQIAEAIGCPVFGLRERPREEEWQALMGRVHALEAKPLPNLREHCRKRARLLQPIHDAVVSGQHWLAYTYGVERVPGESLASAIGRTPNFMKDSFPQARYADEDVATGLVPLEALALRLGVDCAPMTHVIDLYAQQTGIDARAHGRNLRDFDLGYLRRYLLGELQCLKVAC